MLGVTNPQLIRDFASSLNPSSFFDNPDDCSVLLRPMDVVKPCEEELNKSEPGLEIPPLEYSLENTSSSALGVSVPMTVMNIKRWLPVGRWLPEGVVNKLLFDSDRTPNLFFRFRCQLYAVYCEFDRPHEELRERIQQVRSLLLLHRRHWRCVTSRTSSTP